MMTILSSRMTTEPTINFFSFTYSISISKRFINRIAITIPVRERKDENLSYDLKMKLKTLLPTLKEKKRYIAYQVLSEDHVERSMAEEAIKGAVKQLFGDMGLAKAGIIFLKDWEGNKGILKVSHTSVNDVKASMAMITGVGGKKAVVRSVGVSGILNKTRTNFMGG